MEFFSGSAADMLKKYGQAVPEQQPMTSLEEAQAAKAKLDAEKEPEAHFHDGHACTADHSSEHSHDKASAHAHEHDGHACTEDHDHAAHAHDGGHGHKEAAHAHEHGHKKSACSEDHSHDGGHAHDGGHDEEHAAAKDFLRKQIATYEASQKKEAPHDHGEACSHSHDGHEHSHSHDEHPVATALKAGLDASRIEVQAEGSGCGQKLQILVVAKDFEGLTMIKQHRLVNTVAKDELAKVHAFNVKTYTPAKWAARSK